MRINLREIINIPGGEVPFRCEPDLTDALPTSAKGFRQLPAAEGRIRNNAGVLDFSADVDAVAIYVCDRCLCEFEYPLQMHIEATIAESEEDGDSPDIFFLDGDYIDVGEIIQTSVILDLEQHMLCREDCKGLCEKCGANLNEGPCSCKAEIDPRLAVLGQFLENE